MLSFERWLELNCLEIFFWKLWFFFCLFKFGFGPKHIIRNALTLFWCRMYFFVYFSLVRFSHARYRWTSPLLVYLMFALFYFVLFSELCVVDLNWNHAFYFNIDTIFARYISLATISWSMLFFDLYSICTNQIDLIHSLSLSSLPPLGRPRILKCDFWCSMFAIMLMLYALFDVNGMANFSFYAFYTILFASFSSIFCVFLFAPLFFSIPFLLRRNIVAVIISILCIWLIATQCWCLLRATWRRMSHPICFSLGRYYVSCFMCVNTLFRIYQLVFFLSFVFLLSFSTAMINWATNKS